MIKIIKNGKFSHTYIIKCKCGCEFTYNYRDTLMRSPNHYSDDLSRVIACPECLAINSADFVIREDNSKKEEV